MSSLLQPFQEEPACAKMCPNLTYQQRIYGFIGCASFGYFISFIGTMTLFNGFSNDNIRLFAALYVTGNVIALCANGFLCGPKAQCINMWKPTRRFTTAFYLIMIIVVFAVAMAKINIYLVLFLLFIQICAGCWYSISFIPFGRKIVLNFFRSTGLCFPCFYVSDEIHEQYKKHQKANSSTKSIFSSEPSKSESGMFGGKKEKSSFFGSNKV